MDGTRGKLIREPAEALGAVEAEIVVVKPSINISNLTVDRSIKGSDIPDTSSNIPDGKDLAEMFSGGKLTSRISNSPSTFQINRIWGGALECTVICTMAFIRWGMPSEV